MYSRASLESPFVKVLDSRNKNGLAGAVRKSGGGGKLWANHAHEQPELMT